MLLKAKIIIGADGPRSTVAKWAGVVQRNLIPAVQARVALAQPMDATEVYLEPAFRAGYGWLFPKGREANVGLGFRLLRGADPSPRRLLELFLERLQADGKIKGPAISYQAGWIPVEPVRTSVFGNTLLVGDAAGQTHPITGAGIFSAVMCGRMAGQWAARAVREQDHSLLAHYEDEWRDLFGESLDRASRRRRFMEAHWARFNEIIKSSWIAYRDYYAEPAPACLRTPGASVGVTSEDGSLSSFPGCSFRTACPGSIPAISITGSRCDLMCDHCQGKLLESMIPVRGPGRTFRNVPGPRAKGRPRGTDQRRLQPGRVPAVGAVSAGYKRRQGKDPAVHFRARGVHP